MSSLNVCTNQIEFPVFLLLVQGWCLESTPERGPVYVKETPIFLATYCPGQDLNLEMSFDLDRMVDEPAVASLAAYGATCFLFFMNVCDHMERRWHWSFRGTRLDQEFALSSERFILTGKKESDDTDRPFPAAGS